MIDEYDKLKMNIDNLNRKSAKMKTNLTLDVNFEWLKQTVIAFTIVIVIVIVVGIVIMETISKWLGRLR